MSPKRRVGGRARSQSSLINRLTQRRPPLGRSGRGATRDRSHARPIRIQRGSFAVYFRPAVAGLFVIALALGIATSHPVVERILGGEHSAVRVLVRSVAVLGNVRLAAIGPGTSKALVHYRLRADLVPGALPGAGVGDRWLGSCTRPRIVWSEAMSLPRRWTMNIGLMGSFGSCWRSARRRASSTHCLNASAGATHGRPSD